MDYNTAIQILQDKYIVFYIIVSWLLPLLLYFFIGIIRKARSPDGRVLSSPMILSSNFWIAVLIYGLFQLILIAGLIFPIWLRALS